MAIPPKEVTMPKKAMMPAADTLSGIGRKKALSMI
jgi:hypothetical protein